MHQINPPIIARTITKIKKLMSNPVRPPLVADGIESAASIMFIIVVFLSFVYLTKAHKA
jgi:hypothetical protein